MSRYRHGLFKIIIKYELQNQGIEWEQFLSNNGFEDQDTTITVTKNFIQGTRKERPRNETIEIMAHTLEDAEEVQEILGIS
jgi:hypothetical protein